MPLIEYTIDGKIDRVKQAVQRIRNFDPLEMGLMDEPYYIHAFQRMVDRWGYAEKPGSIWTSGEAVYDWWLRKKTIHQIDGQETLW